MFRHIVLELQNMPYTRAKGSNSAQFGGQMETDPWSKRQEKGHLDVLDGSVDCTAQEGEESQVAESSSHPRLRIPRAVPEGVHDPPHKIKVKSRVWDKHFI